jgi:hypothetical protein
MESLGKPTDNVVSWLTMILQNHQINDPVPISLIKHCYQHITLQHINKISDRELNQARCIKGAYKLRKILVTLAHKSPIIAAENDEVGVLAFLYEMHLNKASAEVKASVFWSSDVCSAAAYSGSLSCLKYAHKHGCPWDHDTCIRAVIRGNLACLQYAVENQMYDPVCLTYAEMAGQKHCMRYLSQL